VVNGGGGADFGSYRFAQCPGCFQPGVTVTLDGAANDGTIGENDNIKADVEGLLGSRGGDTLTGQATAVANVFNGYEGNDTLNGNAGDDSLTGGRGTDSLFGGANADMLFSADGNIESVDCGTETDTLVYDAALDTPTGCEVLEDGTATTAALSLRAAVRAADAQHALVKSLR
jgi:Ca2+-binding RTX toxin-like protein